MTKQRARSGTIWSAARAASKPISALGQDEIPAIVIEASEEDCLVMSLVENIARRQHRQIELVQEIGNLRERGYSESEIARKTDLDAKYVRGLLRLLEHGEERLIHAVETGELPITVADGDRWHRR